MRSPAAALAGHLMWTRGGSVWATWQLTAMPYGFRPDADKHAARAAHQALIRALPGESLLVGVAAATDPATVVGRMIDGITLSDCPDWAAECSATLDTLDQIPLGERIFFLSIPLTDTGARGMAGEAWRSAQTEVLDRLGFPRPGVPAAELQRRLEQARKVVTPIPPAFAPRPVSVAQHVWLALHAQQRGLDNDRAQPAGLAVPADLGSVRTGVVLPDPWLDEGGQSDLDRREMRTWNPLERRYVKVACADEPSGDKPASYQALLAVGDLPSGGMAFPGAEFLGRLDECGLDVDWAVRLTVRSSAQVAQENRRALTNLKDQFEQREGELSHGVSVLHDAAAALNEYAQRLQSDTNEVETRATVLFAVASDSPQATNDQARELSDYFAADGYRLTRPLGAQEDLWWAMQPGVPSTRLVRELAQITTSADFAAAMPFVSTDLGGRRGPLLGINISGGRQSAVHHDIFDLPAHDLSASVAIAGEKGGGKSLTMKTIAGYVLDQGGRILAVDRTAVGEWAHWASSVTRIVVADVSDPEYSLDPLRLFGAVDGARAATSFLTLLLNVAPTSPAGVTLSEALEPHYLAQHGLGSLGAVAEHLSGLDDGPAREIGRLMAVFSRKPMGRVIFDSSLPVLDFRAAQGIVIRTHGLALPAAHELLHEHLFRQMTLEKIMGRALYALLAALARRICFDDKNHLAVYFLDEAHHQTNSPEGVAELIDFFRDDRKHNAAAVLGSHDPMADFGDDTLRGLIPTRIQMRQTDKTLARKGLEWLGMDSTDEGLLDVLMNQTSPAGSHGVPEHRRGEAFMRDTSRNIGRMKVMAPSVPARNKAVRTSPPERAAGDAA